MTDERAAAPALDKLDRDVFTRRLISTLSVEIEAVLGEGQAREIVGLVGLGMGEEIERVVAPDVVKRPDDAWTLDDLGGVLVELKRRIEGDFFVEKASRDVLVLGNRRCPFGEEVVGRPSLCMMTSSVFGGIAARHFGFARVDVEQAIARGDAGCRVVVHLKPTQAPRSEWSEDYHGPDPRSE